MEDANFDLWLRYHDGDINRVLTEDELREIALCNLTIKLLIPTGSLISICGGFDNLKKIDLLEDEEREEKISKLASLYGISEKMMEVKIKWLIDNYEVLSLKKEG